MPHRSVLDNISLPLEIRGVSKNERTEVAQRALRMVELGGWGHKFAHELSGGMQQRVGAFPTDEIFRTEASEAVKAFFEAVTTGGSAFFGFIAYIIRVILDFLEIVFVETPWIVVASLIGAKGLGEDVLEALQYASVGQGILAGFAILFCALILDRIVAGAKS